MNAIAPATSFVQPGLFDGPARIDVWPFAGLEPKSYDLVMIDPPTRYELDSEKGETKSPQAQYDTMTIEQIAALPIADLASDNALLWCWATWPLLDRAFEWLDAWGFRYVTGGAWNKRMWGPGYVARSLCEPFLLAKRGFPDVDGRSFANLIEETRREHSRKPEKAYAEAERIMPGARRCEVFACTPRPGWDQWGNELGIFGNGRSKGRNRKQRIKVEPTGLPLVGGSQGARRPGASAGHRFGSRSKSRASISTSVTNKGDHS